MIGKETDVEVLDHLRDTFRLLGESYLWRLCLLVTLPVVALFHIIGLGLGMLGQMLWGYNPRLRY